MIDTANILGDLAKLTDITANRFSAGQRQFARHQIDRLNAVRPFIDRVDPCIAHQLRGTGLFDEPHTAMDLHAHRCGFATDIG